MAEATVAAPKARGRGRLRLRLISVVTLIILGAAVVASSVITQRAIRDQERVLLQERTGEAASVLGSAFAGIQQSLSLLGTIAGAGQGRSSLFVSAARSALTSSTEGLVVTAQRGADMVVTAAAGDAPAVGQVIPADQEPLAHRALSTTGMVSGVLPNGSRSWLAFALGNAAGPGTVVWARVPFSAGCNGSGPDRTVGQPEPRALPVQPARSRCPPRGHHEEPAAGRRDSVSVRRRSRHLAAGRQQPHPARRKAGAGYSVDHPDHRRRVAALVTTVVEAQSRRRDYAAALVEERTASLRQAVTELEQTQAQLVRQEKMAAMGQLASTVGHELRNPLAVIMNVLYLLETIAGAEGSEAMLRHLATAKRETSAATLIVADLLDYSAGRAPMRAPVQLADLVAEALSVVPPPTGIEVVRHVEPDIAIDADRDQMRQVLLNLITNGYDAMPGGGILDVSVRSTGDSARITVSDTGMGMDEETQANIFTPFFTTKSRGIGLGLAVTKRVIEAHGGTISVQSTPSVGTSFTVTVRVGAPIVSVPQ